MLRTRNILFQNNVVSHLIEVRDLIWIWRLVRSWRLVDVKHLVLSAAGRGRHDHIWRFVTWNNRSKTLSTSFFFNCNGIWHQNFSFSIKITINGGVKNGSFFLGASGWNGGSRSVASSCGWQSRGGRCCCLIWKKIYQKDLTFIPFFILQVESYIFLLTKS